MIKLKVIHIDTHAEWRGGQRQALELIKRLGRRGIYNVLACKPGSEISKRAHAEGITVVHFPFRGEWDVVSAYQLRNYIRSEKIHIAHAHTSHGHGIAILALWKMKECKLVVSRRVDFHLHSYYSKKVKYGPAVDKIITVSDAVRRILIEDGIDPKRVVTIRSGFIIEEFADTVSSRDLRAELGLPSDAVVTATVAALAPHKAHYVLLKAAHNVIRKHPEAVFLFAGEGEMKSSIERDIHSLGLQRSVFLLGFVKDIVSVYNAADIFAISSREEGLCSSIFDAMYFNLPVVATSAGGIPEIVQDGVNGYIVPIDDYMSFAERINYLIENPEIRGKMGSRSSSILLRNTIEHTVNSTVDVYLNVLNGSSEYIV
ncbi:glycosyltransferase [bacterium]|nr:glycosyltransferase [bacterium]